MSYNSYIIKRLDSSYRQKLYRYLISLDSETIYNRFCGYLTNEAIKFYVSKINFDTDGIYGVFDSKLSIVGLGECFLSADNKAELGFSVSLPARGKGLGLKLLECLIEFASANKVEKLVMICLKTNHISIHLAKKLNLLFTTDEDGEKLAVLDLSLANHYLDKYRVDFKDKIAYYEIKQRKVVLH